jgi:hypothetical protein
MVKKLNFPLSRILSEGKVLPIIGWTAVKNAAFYQKYERRFLITYIMKIKKVFIIG